ncbi:MAG: oligosaccharide flippase family protein [Bacteroidetes bacterium]|nr:oligosaccharide flippase family protein [Bacteroidota bacterium]
MAGHPKILTNFFSLGMVQVINALLQLVVVPPVIARIGLENYGIIAVAQVLMFYMATFTDYGFNQTATREVSLHRDDTAVLSRLFSLVYITKLLLCVAAFAMLLLLAFLFPIIREHFLLYVLAFVFVPGYASQPVWFLQGLEKMQWLAMGTLAARIIFVVLVFVFIKGPADSGLFLFFFGLGNLVAGMISMAAIIRSKRLQLFFPGWHAILTELKAGWTITLTALSMNVTQYGNLFILRLFTNDLVAGYYGVAERIFFTMKQGLTVFSQSIYPQACRLATHSLEQLKTFLRRAFVPFFLLILTGSALVFIFAPQLIRFFAKADIPSSVFALRTLALFIPLISCSIPPTVSLLAFDQRKTYAGIYIAAMLLNILANLVLVHYWGMKGTLIAVGITELAILISTWLMVAALYKKMDVSRQPDRLL